MQAVVPAAGMGTRLRPVTNSIPKGLVPICGRPILWYCLSSLVDLGVTEIIVVIGYRGRDIVEYFGYEFEGIPVRYVRQLEQRGLGDALLAAAHEITDDFVVLNGDNVCCADLDRVVSRHQTQSADATILVDSVSEQEARETGVVTFDADGDVSGFVEKPDDPPSQQVTTGFFVLSPVVFNACRLLHAAPGEEYELTAAVDLVVTSGRRVEIVELDGWCVNVNTPSDLRRAERYLASA